MYTAHAFKQAGYAVSHERVGLDGCISWYHGSPFAYSPEGRFRPEFRAVALQVRDPIQAISSMRVLSMYTLSHVIDPTLGTSKADWPEDETLRRVMFWLRWHNWIEEVLRPAFVFKVEALPACWHTLCDVLNVPMVPMPKVPQDINAMPHTSTSWEEIRALSPELHAELHELATRYGYRASPDQST
jgi:hypothetical protein